jgi:hypothetical protein
MSGVASLANVPGTDEELVEWSFAHAAHHADIIRVIYQINQVALPSFILDPVDINNSEIWADQHQQMHLQMDAILGISPLNIDEWDWRDKSTLGGNIWANFSEHLQASEILEIG